MPRGLATANRQGKNIPKATSHPTARDLEWAAGFLEGEGSFGKWGTTHTVQAAQVNQEPLLRIQTLFGGWVKPRKTMQPGHQNAWVWRVSGARARGIMMTLYSLLSER